jgi:mono/diheme cytochrome c family protein
VNHSISFAHRLASGVRVLARAIAAVAAIAAITMMAFLPAWPVNSAAAATTLTPEQKELFAEGARLWPVYCAQCHNARPGSQFSPAQWDAITMHMRTQSIMPAKDMRAIKEFLKEAR